MTTHDYSVAHFVEGALESISHFDLRILRSAWTLLTRPGWLTRDYLSGKRRASVGPMQLFIVMNILYALSGWNSFRTPLAIQEQDPPFTAFKQARVTSAIVKSGLNHEEFGREFNAAAGTQGKTWILVMIPAFAGCLAALYGFRRYFFEHLVFAAHFYAFVLAVMLITSLTVTSLLLVLHLHLGSRGLDALLSSIDLGAFILYLFLALRRAYGDGAMASAIRAVVLAGLLTPILMAYRFLLFFVTLWAMH
ncbi:MAG: DUF3667 domain-containing protein [Acidobacteriota bacterium]